VPSSSMVYCAASHVNLVGGGGDAFGLITPVGSIHGYGGEDASVGLQTHSCKDSGSSRLMLFGRRSSKIHSCGGAGNTGLSTQSACTMVLLRSGFRLLCDVCVDHRLNGRRHLCRGAYRPALMVEEYTYRLTPAGSSGCPGRSAQIVCS
jgi:hypothetical protein